MNIIADKEIVKQAIENYNYGVGREAIDDSFSQSKNGFIRTLDLVGLKNLFGNRTTLIDIPVLGGSSTLVGYLSRPTPNYMVDSVGRMIKFKDILLTYCCMACENPSVRHEANTAFDVVRIKCKHHTLNRGMLGAYMGNMEEINGGLKLYILLTYAMEDILVSKANKEKILEHSYSSVLVGKNKRYFWSLNPLKDSLSGDTCFMLDRIIHLLDDRTSWYEKNFNADKGTIKQFFTSLRQNEESVIVDISLLSHYYYADNAVKNKEASRIYRQVYNNIVEGNYTNTFVGNLFKKFIMIYCNTDAVLLKDVSPLQERLILDLNSSVDFNSLSKDDKNTYSMVLTLIRNLEVQNENNISKNDELIILFQELLSKTELLSDHVSVDEYEALKSTVKEKQGTINRMQGDIDRLRLKLEESESESNSEVTVTSIGDTKEVTVELDSNFDKDMRLVNTLDMKLLVLGKKDLIQNLSVLDSIFKSVDVVDMTREGVINSKVKNSDYDYIIMCIDVCPHTCRFIINSNNALGKTITVRGRNVIRWLPYIFNGI